MMQSGQLRFSHLPVTERFKDAKLIIEKWELFEEKEGGRNGSRQQKNR